MKKNIVIYIFIFCELSVSRIYQMQVLFNPTQILEFQVRRSSF